GVFRIGHESATSGELFEDFLETVDHSQIEKIWFDLKNLSGTNYQHVLQALESLDAKFGLKNRLILESGTTQKWFKLFRDAGWHTSYYAPTSKMIKLIKNNDIDGMEALADTIASQAKVQNLAAVSFDHRAYPFIKQYLERKLAPYVVYHS